MAIDVKTAIAPRNKVYFNVTVLNTLNGKELIAPKPDADGYRDMCVAVLGVPSRNGPFYDVDSILHQVNDPSTVFHTTLTQGNLYGEFGHPPDDAPLSRIDTIVEDRYALHIRALYTGDPLSDGGIPIYAKLCPAGVFGDQLEKSLLSKYQNTAFSLRSLVTQRWDAANNRQHRTVVRLVTFDYVGMGGYLAASKWYAKATESYTPSSTAPTSMDFCREITPEMLFDTNGNRTGLESFSDKEIMDVFGIKEVTLNNLKLGAHISGSGTYFGMDGNKHSITHALLNTTGE